MAEKKVWSGTPPKECDICHRPIKDVFIDGKTPFGAWGFMCPGCHLQYGSGLGTGKGQKYRLKNGVWEKVGG